MAGSAPSPERRRLVESLFEAGLEHPSAGRRDWLRRECGDDAELLDEVLHLLAAHERAEGILELPSAGVARLLLRAAGGAPPVERVGPYRLVREIGRGGMGTVHLAERDDRHFDQRVAVKLMAPGMEGSELAQRFLAERQILASLQHPNIARLLDGGVADDGRPYLVMEYVDGLPIDLYCDRHALSVEARLRLFCAAARAVQYAHRNLVVHRDLKPSNVLVDERGELKLLDFGIAKILDPATLRHTLPLTRPGNRLMTPEYASPEQVLGGPVTTATDVYGLGLLLYELLCGQRAHRLEGASAAEIEKVVCRSEPLRPSDAVLLDAERAARARATQPARLRRRLAGDLDRIVACALRKEPERRYPSAEQLAADVERFLEGRPVTARPDSAAYRVRKFAGRHRWPLLTAAAFVLVLAGYAATVTVHARRTGRALDLARLEAERTEQVVAFTMGLFESSHQALAAGDSLTVGELLRRGAGRAERMSRLPEAQAQMFDVIGRVHQSLGEFEEAQPFLERSLALRQREYGPRHPSTAEAVFNLAELQFARGRYSRAEALYREALAMQRSLLGPEAAQVARTLNRLGVLRQDRGDWRGSEQLTREALAIRRRLYGAEHPRVAESLSSLAIQLQLQGDHRRAEPLFREALAMYRRLYGDEHPDVARATSNLGLLLFVRGDHDRAEPLYRDALAMRRRLLGDEHPDVSMSLGLLGALKRRQGAFPAAESLYLAAVEAGRRSIGVEHPDMAHVLNGLALVLRDRGDYPAADSLFREVLALRRRILGREHPAVASTLQALGTVRERRGDLAEAERLYREALAIRLRLLGERHPQVLELRGLLAALEERRRSP